MIIVGKFYAFSDRTIAYNGGMPYGEENVDFHTVGYSSKFSKSTATAEVKK
jgi:hypothetical protein